MDGFRLPGYGKELQKDDGLSRSLDSGSDPQWIEVCHPTGGHEPLLNFQLRSDQPRERDGSATKRKLSQLQQNERPRAQTRGRVSGWLGIGFTSESISSLSQWLSLPTRIRVALGCSVRVLSARL